MAKIENLLHVAEALEELGYAVNSNEDAVHVAIGGTEKPFVAVLTISERGELVVTSQIATLGDLNEDDIPTVQFGLLDANTRVRPFAFAIITSADNPDIADAADFPIVVTDSLPIGDLCKAELAAEMDGLLFALNSSGEALRSGLPK